MAMEMRFAGAGSADQHVVALLRYEPPVANFTDQALVDPLIGVPVKTNSSISLAIGSLAMVSWYLIERACFRRSQRSSRAAFGDPRVSQVQRFRGSDCRRGPWVSPPRQDVEDNVGGMMVAGTPGPSANRRRRGP